MVRVGDRSKKQKRSDEKERLTVRCSPELAYDLKASGHNHNISDNLLYVEALAFCMNNEAFNRHLDLKYPRDPRRGAYFTNSMTYHSGGDV